MKAAAGLPFAVVFGMTLQSQPGPQPAAFEVAEIHNSAPSPQQAMRGGVPRDGIYRLRKATMVDLVRVAYGVDADKVTGGPSWIELDRFDITAKVPPGANRETVKPMLQALLADRFKLVVRPEPKPFPVQTLVTAGTPKLKEASGSGAGSCQQSIEPPTPGRPTITLVMSCKSTSLAAFAERLGGLAGGTQVVDATGLSGLWDFDFRFTPDSGALQLNATTVSGALEKSLGLKLEARSVSLPTVTVVSVNRTPTPNAPAAAAAFSAAAVDPEFEVAEIKTSIADRQSRQILPTGQLTMTAMTMRMLVSFAFLEDQAQIVGPKSLDGPKYDLIAKYSSRPVDPSEIDPDEIGVMLRRLLVERVHLKAHREDRVMDAPSLVAAGAHKLAKAAPDSRTKCTQGVAPRRETSAPVPVMQIKCQNMTVAEFAERAQRFDPGTFKAPIADETHIDGRWDISVDFTPSLLLNSFQQATASARAAAQAAGVAQAPGASEPMGVMPLSQALEKQLGLKIDTRRRPVSVLVVDSFDEKPTEN